MAALAIFVLLSICISACIAGPSSPVFEGIWASSRSTNPVDNIAENALDGVPSTYVFVPSSSPGCFVEIAVSPAYVDTITIHSPVAMFPFIKVFTKPYTFTTNDISALPENDVSLPDSESLVTTTQAGFIPYGFVTYQINRPVSRIRIYSTNSALGLLISDIFVRVAEPLELLSPVLSLGTGFSATFPARYALDKTLNTFAHSDGENEPKLTFNFASSLVRRIVIWNRQDCCQARLAPFYVLLKNGPFTTTSPVSMLAEATWSIYNTASNQATYSFPVDSTVQMTHMAIVQMNSEYMNIAEITVFGTQGSVLMSPMKLLRAPIMQHSLSTNFPSMEFPSTLAFDGKLDTFAHTDIANDQYIEASFAQAQVTSVVVVNRQSCCQNRMDPFYVFLKNAPFSGTGVEALKSEPEVSYYEIRGTFSSYTIKMNKVTASRIRVVGNSWNYQHFAEVIVYKDVILSPQITQVEPNAVNYNGGTRITVTGSGFSYAASDMQILVSVPPTTQNGGVGMPYRFSCTNIIMIEPYTKFSCVAPAAQQRDTLVGMWPTTRGPQGSNYDLLFLPNLFRYTDEPSIVMVTPTLWTRNSGPQYVTIQGRELGTSTTGMTISFTSADGSQTVQCTGIYFTGPYTVSCSMGGLSVQGPYHLAFTSTSSAHVNPLTLQRLYAISVLP